VKDRVSSKKVEEGETGWFGAVSKTTDGGKTWSQVKIPGSDASSRCIENYILCGYGRCS
jgi:photosystem II stability/assembly factor-like uncharacterized protein